MTLTRKIAAALDARPATGALPVDLEIAEGPYHLRLHLEAAGPVGLAFSDLSFTAAERADRTLDDLKRWGARLAARLSYLMEPLVLHEADPISGEVSLRSQSPTPRSGAHSFYEIRLNLPGTLHLRRLGFDQSTRRRQPVPCQMTLEVLERLTDDLVATVQEP